MKSKNMKLGMFLVGCSVIFVSIIALLFLWTTLLFIWIYYINYCFWYRYNLAVSLSQVIVIHSLVCQLCKVFKRRRKKMMKAWSFWKWCERQEKLPTGKAIAIPTKIHTICIWAKCYLWHLETFEHEMALESSCTLLSRCDQSRANVQRGNGMFTIKLMHVQIIL